LKQHGSLWRIVAKTLLSLPSSALYQLQKRKKEIKIYDVVFFSKLKNHTENRYVD
jgi:hypothetical protein